MLEFFDSNLKRSHPWNKNYKIKNKKFNVANSSLTNA